MELSQFRKVVVGTFLAASPLLLATAAQASAHAVATNWAETGTKSFDTHGLHSLGLAASGEMFEINVSLKLVNKGQLDEYVKEQSHAGSPAFHTSLKPADFVKRYAPGTAQVKAVVDYLTAQGFRDIDVKPNNLLISAQGSAATIRSAFNTEIEHFDVDGRNATANTKPIMIPGQLAGTVLAVFGLDTITLAHPMYKELAGSGTNSTNATGIIPTAFPLAYDATTVSPATSTNIGIIMTGNISQVSTDFKAFETKYNLTYPAPVVVLPQGKAGISTGYVEEGDLDAQDIAGMSGGYKSLTIYDGFQDLYNATLTAVFNSIVSQQYGYTENIDGSFGGCETSSSASFITSSDQLFEEAVAQGQTFFFSTGDSTSNECGTGAATVSYPASSPYVAAIGGTTLNLNSNGTYLSESVWYTSSTEGTGGGVSSIEPAYTAQNYVLHNSYRELPDVSFDGDPNTGAIIVYNGRNTQVGGTSLSAPLATAFYSRMDSQYASAGQLGFFPVNLYYSQVYSLPTVYLHDVTTGSNGAYSAAPGYDLASGYGSIDAGKFVTDFNYLLGL